jgi:hypothetical protein
MKEIPKTPPSPQGIAYQVGNRPKVICILTSWLKLEIINEPPARASSLPSLLKGFRNPLHVETEALDLSIPHKMSERDLQAQMALHLQELIRKTNLMGIGHGVLNRYDSDARVLILDSSALTALALLEHAFPALSENHGSTIPNFLEMNLLPPSSQAAAFCLFFAQLASHGVDGAFYNFMAESRLLALMRGQGVAWNLQELMGDVLILQSNYLKAIYRNPE